MALRVGVLGPGNIFYQVLLDIHKAPNIEITAVGSRSPERALEAQRASGAAHAFSSYEELVRCDQVDLIYIATPHNLHKEQALLAMNHKKHVLCEKPMAINDAQVREMRECAKRNGVFLMEGMWTRFFPAMHEVRALIESDAIGEVRQVTANFAFPGKYDPESRLYNPHLAGGALLDLGIYTMMAATMVLGYDIESCRGTCQLAPTGVDLRETLELKYASGATAQLYTGMDAMSDVRMMVFGSKGYLDIPDFYHPTRFTQVDLQRARTEYTFAPEKNGLYHEFVHVAECIEAGLLESPIMTLDETEAVSRIMTELRREWGVRYPEEA